MDAWNTFVGAVPLDLDVPMANRFAIQGVGYLAQMAMGSSTAVSGFACTPASSGLGVTIGPGSLTQLATLAPVAAGSMVTDATPCVQQGINDLSTALSFSGTGTWTVYGSLSVALGGTAVLAYYNAGNPSQTFSGSNNNGQPSQTQVQARVTLGVNQGAIPAGSVALYTVTVPSGATSMSGAMIALAAGAPFYPTIPELAATLVWTRVLASTTITPPAWATRLEAIKIGAGAGGAGCYVQSGGIYQSGAGGGAGAILHDITPISFSPYNFNIGAAGAGSGAAVNNVPPAGGNGGSTSITDSIGNSLGTAGGASGGYWVNTVSSAGGAGGVVAPNVVTASGYAIVHASPGSAGSDGQSGPQWWAGNGAPSPYGALGRAAVQGNFKTATCNAGGFGAGGGGAYEPNTGSGSSFSGGAGAPGLIIYRWLP